MKILRGDIYWVHLRDPTGSEPGYSHPAVVVQSDIANKSDIDTVVCCEITETQRAAKSRENIVLVPGEADLPEHSVVNVSQIFTVDKTDLGDCIGRLRPDRVEEIIDGINHLMGRYKRPSTPY